LWHALPTIEELNDAFFVALHPYYKLQYIQLAWGGEEGQAEERAVGNRDAKNWQDEARKILEDTMESYWRTRLRASTTTASNVAVTHGDASSGSFSSEYDCLH
jgi:hypothetical protein